MRIGRAAAADRPNILFIYTDDHSYRTVSAYPEAYSWVRTPTIDGLAKQGIRFTSAYIGTWCMPSRAGVAHWTPSVRASSPCGWKGLIRDASMMRRRRHSGPRYFEPMATLRRRSASGTPARTQGMAAIGIFRSSGTARSTPKPALITTTTSPSRIKAARRRSLKRYSTDQYTDWAIDLIKGKDRDPKKPWYLWLCYGAVHGPYTPADRHMNEYPGIEVANPADIFPPRLGKPDWAQKVSHWEKGPDGTPMSNKRSLTSWVRQYHQGVNAIDEGVKRLLQALEESGQRKNTLIVFTSDQGLAFGQHGFLGTKIAAYDANIRSPMIVSMPGRIPEGVVCQAPVVGIDLVPTFFRFAGIKLPWEMHGRDLSPLLKDPQANWPHPAMLTATGQKFGSDTNVIPEGKGVFHGDVPWYVMIRERRYKYVRPLIHDLEELYDMQQDPEELNNLAVKPEHRKTLMRLRALAIAELRRSKAGFVDRMPAVREFALNQ